KGNQSIGLILQGREAIELRVHCRHRTGEKLAENDPNHTGDRGDHQHEFDEVDTHLPIVVAKRIERVDVFPLRGYYSRQDDIQQEAGYRKENRRRHERHRAQLLDFIVDESRGDLLIPAIRARATIRLEDAINRLNDWSLIATMHEREGNGIERPLHVKGGLQFRLSHPEDTEESIVWQDAPGANLEDIFGRERHPHDSQFLMAAIDHRADRISQVESVRVDESLAGQGFARLQRIGKASSPQI